MLFSSQSEFFVRQYQIIELIDAKILENLRLDLLEFCNAWTELFHLLFSSLWLEFHSLPISELDFGSFLDSGFGSSTSLHGIFECLLDLTSVLELSEDELADFGFDIDAVFDHDFGFSFDFFNVRQWNVQLSVGLFWDELDCFFGDAQFASLLDFLTIAFILFEVQIDLSIFLERLMNFKDLVKKFFWKCELSIYLFLIIVPQPQLIFNWSFLLYLNQRFLNIWQLHWVCNTVFFVGCWFLVEKGKDFTKSEQQLVKDVFDYCFDWFEIQGVHKFVDSAFVSYLIAVHDIFGSIKASTFELDFEERNCDSFVFGDFLSDVLNLFNSFSAMDPFLADFSKTVFEGADSIEHELDRRLIDFEEFIDLLERVFGKSSFLVLAELFGDQLKVFLCCFEIIFNTQK